VAISISAVSGLRSIISLNLDKYSSLCGLKSWGTQQANGCNNIIYRRVDMKSRRTNWVAGIGAAGLVVGCLGLAGFILGTTASDAQAGPIDDFKGGKAVELSKRFTILDSFNKEAALDNETGLVWEMVPQRAMTVWKNAAGICAKKTVGGKQGWRLPSLKELETLADHSIYPPPVSLKAIPFPTSSIMAIGRQRNTKSIPSAPGT